MPNLIAFLLEMQLPNPDFSKKNIDLFLAISPPSKKGDSFEMLAEIFKKTGQLEKAVSFYEKAFEYKHKETRLGKIIESLKKQIKERREE